MPTPPKHIRTTDLLVIDEVFAKGGGHVLHLAIRRLSELCEEEFGVDLYEPRWAANSDSKAKRLRTYLRQAERETALQTLQALWGPMAISQPCRANSRTLR